MNNKLDGKIAVVTGGTPDVGFLPEVDIPKPPSHTDSPRPCLAASVRRPAGG